MKSRPYRDVRPFLFPKLVGFFSGEHPGEQNKGDLKLRYFRQLRPANIQPCALLLSPVGLRLC